jgi:transposase
MTSRNDLDLEQKVKLIKDKENGMSVRELKDKFSVCIGSVSNILKRKNEYLDDYECNKNKKMKRKTNNSL